ncbi:glycosyltransferase family 4 protein [Lentimicrobium sp. S6]|uniref:glycosyltransferase family 4 protein n=1 Tax=Lentimicrobium sp. S6 TaxID=2735872 RepID=UPI00155372B4|nr:glycosyltransferase family 4 protein [Lentimicrobium sp. S6]NPD46729.1 glycosyltransferase family 4 protein [Lentimicrobium sp. S6]
MDKMRILILGNYKENKGGISGVIYNHITKIRSEGRDVKIFNTKKTAINRILLIFPLLRELRKYNVIHIHGCSNLGFYPILIGIIASKCIYNRRTIVTYHGGGAKLFLQKWGWFVRPLLSKVDAVTVMSGFLQNIFTEHRIKTIILPNLLNVVVRNEGCLNFDKPRLISIRALKKIYNIDDIIKSFKLVHEKYPDAQLVIAGTGSKAEELSDLREKLNLSNISFLGFLNNKQIPEELLKSNIMISVPSFDNQPMSILEAFASGVPVISSNVGGVPFMIKDGVNGFMVDVNCPKQIAEKISWIMNNPGKTIQIADNAKKELKQYQWESIRGKLFDIYEGG